MDKVIFRNQDVTLIETAAGYLTRFANDSLVEMLDKDRDTATARLHITVSDIYRYGFLVAKLQRAMRQYATILESTILYLKNASFLDFNSASIIHQAGKLERASERVQTLQEFYYMQTGSVFVECKECKAPEEFAEEGGVQTC